ncbi:MAG: hypothetical protein ACE5R4_18165 [Armatimonadota bacterium]
MNDTLRDMYKRAMLSFCRAMFSADLGHANAREVLKRTWREHGTYLARALGNGLAADDPAAAAAELDRRFGELLGFRGEIERRDGQLLTRWDECPLWEEMKSQRLEKAFTCVAACDALSAQMAEEVCPEVRFERGNQMPMGGSCEKIWRGPEAKGEQS